MSTSTFDVPHVTTIREWSGSIPAHGLYSVSASSRVNADRARIFQAITVPEYVETWFSAPGCVPGYTRVFVRGSSFCVWGMAEGGSHFRIFCTYRVCRRSKLVFSWEREGSAMPNASLVRIRLQGDFGRTTVDVTHTGLGEPERQWCGDLWKASLQKLSRLF